MRPVLFPSPRRVEWLGGSVSTARAPEVRVDPAISREGYRLTADGDGVRIDHSDSNGLRYAIQRLDQLRTDDGIACCRIEDDPDVAVRGYMLDVSRDRVPTRETLTHLVDRLARCRYNHLQLYTEHTYAYEGHDEVWADASPLTAADVEWLDQTCAQQGIELVANQNTFGHMERWLRHDTHRHRAECPGGVRRHGRTAPPAALAATPENADFAVGLVRELAANVTSRTVNIGCDEIFELGDGVSAEPVAARGRTAVFVEHVARIVGPLAAEGLRSMYWADMVERAPEMARPLTDLGATAIMWSYLAPDTIDPDAVDWTTLPDGLRDLAEGFARAARHGFGERVARFVDAGVPTWVAPGTSGWNSFVGRHRNARHNIADAVSTAVTHGLEGVLVTEWGDNGHHQPPFATLPALGYGGATMWCEEANSTMTDSDLADAVSSIVGDDTGTLGGVLIDLGTAVDRLALPQLNESAFVRSWVRGGFLSPRGELDRDAARRTIGHIEDAVARLANSRPHAPDGDQLLHETRVAAAMATHGTRRLLDENTDDFDALVASYREVWLGRSRGGGLDDSVAKLRPPR